ncbi:hypothetical protein D3C86_2084930 [compost metagenome]
MMLGGDVADPPDLVGENVEIATGSDARCVGDDELRLLTNIGKRQRSPELGQRVVGGSDR